MTIGGKRGGLDLSDSIVRRWIGILIKGQVRIVLIWWGFTLGKERIWFEMRH
jgi:hypothetical protein